jgi:hypothetical protein
MQNRRIITEYPSKERLNQETETENFLDFFPYQLKALDADYFLSIMPRSGG